MMLVWIVRWRTSSTTSLDTHHHNIQTLLRQASRYALASLQDESLLVAVLHANYGAGYWWAVRDIYTTDEIETATSGIPMSAIETQILGIQDTMTRQLIHSCPNARTQGFTSSERSAYGQLFQLAGYG